MPSAWAPAPQSHVEAVARHHDNGPAEPPPQAMMLDDTSPPLPYDEADSRRAPDTSMPAPMAKQQPACIFYGRRFIHKTTIWTHVDRHLTHRPTRVVPCPRLECRFEGVELDDEMAFKKHVKAAHGIELRPKITA